MMDDPEPLFDHPQSTDDDDYDSALLFEVKRDMCTTSENAIGQPNLCQRHSESRRATILQDVQTSAETGDRRFYENAMLRHESVKKQRVPLTTGLSELVHVLLQDNCATIFPACRHSTFRTDDPIPFGMQFIEFEFECFFGT
jgi:hypothetical protein